MAIVKVIEVLAQSEQSWEDAVQVALNEAKKTIRNIQSIYVKEFQAIVDQQQNISAYRVNCKISFLVEDASRD
jgi:flavin-binding protein dodecin